MSNNNPYELRAGLLRQTADILTHRFHAKIDDIRFRIEHGAIDVNNVQWPEPPSADDIIKEARKLYEFVQTK